MAVQSKPSLRSSSRKKKEVEVPPADNQHRPLLNTRRGKRTRDNSLGSESNTSVKRQKSSPPSKADRSKGNLKSRALKSLPLRDRADAVTSRSPESPLPNFNHQLNGFTATTTPNDFDLQDDHEIINDNTCNISTANTFNTNDKRSLRSHDGGSRSKSELALYFPNYDELVSIESKKPEFLTPETVLYIIDEPSKSKHVTPSSSTLNHASIQSQASSKSNPPISNGVSHHLNLSETTFTDLNNATRLTLPTLDKTTRHQKDPLSDAFYMKAHRRVERQEKRLRSIEKERAMHEKSQLERLMDGLKGHDWLRVMGISGITDSEKKLYEPKREYFIQEVRVLLKKFQEWKEEEKRRKVEKEESMFDEDEEDEDEEDEGEEDDEEDASDEDRDANSTSPISSSPNTSAARQLHHESLLAAKSKPKPKPKLILSQPRRSHHKKPLPSTHQPPEKPFTSFYSKPYLREAAISKHRRGRARYAFGHPLPEPEERDFELEYGGEILTEEAVRAVERRRRVGRRGAGG